MNTRPQPRRMRCNALPVVLFCARRNHGLNHLRRDARHGRARAACLLRRLSLQPLDRDHNHQQGSRPDWDMVADMSLHSRTIAAFDYSSILRASAPPSVRPLIFVLPSSQQMLRVANPTTLFAMADAGHERGYRRNRQFIRKIIVNAIPQFRSVRTMRWNWPELKTTIVRIALIASKSFA